MATYKKFSEKVLDAYTRLGENGQLDIYARYGAGTYEKRPDINPLTGDNEAHSPAFSLMPPNGGLRIRWKDFKSDDNGDLFDFIKKTQGESRARFLLELDEGAPKPSQTPDPFKPKPAPPKLTKKDHRPIALQIWNHTTPANKAATDYLSKRKITSPIPKTIRSSGKVIISKIEDRDGSFMAIHRIWITTKEKKILAHASGGAIRLGEIDNGALGISEGIENGLAVQQALNIPVWAAISTAGMKNIQLPSHATKIFIFSDSDPGKAGQKAATALADRLIAEGREVIIVFPVDQPETGQPPKTDFNDLLELDHTGQSIRDRFESAVPAIATVINPMAIGKPTEPAKRGLIQGIEPAFNAQEAIAAQEASKQLSDEITAFMADADRAIQLKQAIDTAKEARKSERNRLYSEWLANHPEWLEPLPPDNVRSKLARQAKKITPIFKTEKQPVPQLQIGATAGIGKSRAVLEALATDIWKRRNVDYHVPIIDLAHELAAEAKKHGIKVQVIQGRNKDNCIKPNAAREAGACGLNVMESLCVEGTLTCSNFQNCSYLEQFRKKDVTLRILSHDWLFLPRSSQLPKPDLIIVDENIALKAASQTSFHPDRLDDDGKKIIKDHLDNKAPFMETVRAVGITKESALEKARALKAEVKETVHPKMNESMSLSRIAKLKEKSTRAMEAFWRQVHREWDYDRDYNGIEIKKDHEIGTNEGSELQNRVFVMKRKTISRAHDTPVLMIDADADIKINRLLFGQDMKEVRINAKLNAHVVQVHSSAFTKMSLLTDEKLIGNVKKFIQKEASKADGKVLVVANKRVRDLLEQDWAGVTFAHFGAILGVDEWKNHKTVIILGREQPRPEHVERTARALFWDQKEALNLSGVWEKSERGYQMTHGQKIGVNVQVHADPNVQSILELIRERQSGQAISRLRMVHATEKKRVIIMSNVPLDICVDELVTTKELFAGGNPLSQAFQAMDGVLPLSAPWLVNSFPEWFKSVRQTKRLISNEKKGCHFPYSLYMENGTLNFRLEGKKGSLQTCLSIHDLETTRTKLEEIFSCKVILLKLEMAEKTVIHAQSQQPMAANDGLELPAEKTVPDPLDTCDKIRDREIFFEMLRDEVRWEWPEMLAEVR